MVFKQGVAKFEKEILMSVIITFGVVYVLMFGLLLVPDLDRMGILFVFLFYSLLCAFVILSTLPRLEWFYVYNDRIEAVGVYGKKNIVYFKDVLCVKEESLAVVNYHREDFFVFDDGRKNYKDNLIHHLDSHLNKKKYNFVVPKTEQLEDYITNVLKLEIVKKEKKPWER